MQICAGKSHGLGPIALHDWRHCEHRRPSVPCGSKRPMACGILGICLARRPSRRALRATSQGEHSSKRCPRCARPWRVCLCGALPAAQLESRTQITLFTHPKEAKRALGTGPLLQLCLKRVVKLVAKEFPDPEKDPNFHQQLKAQPLLLYPGRDAVELSRTETPLSLILIDARWDQARIMLNRSEWLKRLPRATIPFQQSGYMWRRQPAPGCVSTLEAAAEALRILEPHGQQLKSALLQPFQKMVQLQCQFMPKAEDKNADLGTAQSGPANENASRLWTRSRRRRRCSPSP
ncbi:unnamed protein product [Effrenium voratum]|nr:unnamed protein product [Effrenium voratum]CAJ1458949.1 unnamed protein product [Effrenium voratum]